MLRTNQRTGLCRRFVFVMGQCFLNPREQLVLTVIKRNRTFRQQLLNIGIPVTDLPRSRATDFKYTGIRTVLLVFLMDIEYALCPVVQEICLLARDIDISEYTFVGGAGSRLSDP